MHTKWYYQNEVREGLRMRNHTHPVLRERNRKRVKYAIMQLRDGAYYEGSSERLVKALLK